MMELYFAMIATRPGGNPLAPSRDTHPKDGDVKQAPLVSGANSSKINPSERTVK